MDRSRVEEEEEEALLLRLNSFTDTAISYR